MLSASEDAYVILVVIGVLLIIAALGFTVFVMTCGPFFDSRQWFKVLAVLWLAGIGLFFVADQTLG